MPTRVPKMNSCGTRSPIWMSGSHHPFIEEGALNRTACAKLFYFIEWGQHQRFRNCSVFLSRNSQFESKNSYFVFHVIW